LKKCTTLPYIPPDPSSQNNPPDPVQLNENKAIKKKKKSKLITEIQKHFSTYK
jgi:hypothetical protein